MSKIKQFLQTSDFFKQYKTFALFLFYSFLVFSPFLTGRQRVHDSYAIELYAGYGRMIRALFAQGRVLSSWFYRVLLALEAPYTLTMAVSVGASLVFLSLAAYLVFFMVRKYNGGAEKSVYILAALGGLMLVFNLFIAESMLFFENAIMSFGILMAVVAAKFALDGHIKGYAISFFCMVLSVFSYQATTAFFPPLVALFLGAIVTTRDETERAAGFKAFWLAVLRLVKKALPAVAIYVIALLLHFVFLRNIAGDDGRFYGETRIWENIRRSDQAFRGFAQDQFGFMPAYIFSGFLVVFLLFLLFYTLRKKQDIALLASLVSFGLIFVATFLILLPMATDDWYILPRSGVAMAGIGGLILVSISLFSKRVSRVLVCIAALFVLLISQRQIDIQLNSHANNQLDMHELAMMGERLRAFEDYHDITIDRIYFGYDCPKIWFRPHLNNYHDLTISMWHVDWMAEPLLRYYLGRDISVTRMSDADMARIGPAREAHWITGGRMVFDGDVVYLILNNIR
ncbi:MAG: glucosyltransferase domain-containing protein [Oscillospiraceae bacterium]|nr:glucosyltransferase domain-containing protein [Oscillospiraceae bacterium]